MSTPRFFLICFLSLTTCRVDPKRETTAVRSKVSRAQLAPTTEIFPRVFAEPQPISDAILVQPQVTECLAGTTTLANPYFSLELSGRVTDAGRVVEAKVDGAEPVVAACLARALSDLLLLPHGAGPFHLNLSKRSEGAGPGVIVEPGGAKKFE